MGTLPERIDTPSPPFQVKREVPRFALIVDVEVTEPNTSAHMSGRIAEISRKGCFIDILNTPPVGTRVNIVISRDHGTFTTQGTIIYKQEGKGMGVVFKQPAPEQLRILDKWLEESVSLRFFEPSR
jgi:PilZ domain-containing protein